MFATLYAFAPIPSHSSTLDCVKRYAEIGNVPEQKLREIDAQIRSESKNIELPSLNRMSVAEERDYFRSISDFWTFCETHLTKDEFKAVEAYTSYLSRPTSPQRMNEALRAQKNGFGETMQIQDAEKVFATTLTRALKKLPGHDGISFRGAAIPKSILGNLHSGSEWNETAFLSTSLDPNVAEKFSFPHGSKNSDPNYSTIFVIKGRSGKPISGKLGIVRAEREVLFAPGTKFTITSIKVDDTSQRARIYMFEQD